MVYLEKPALLVRGNEIIDTRVTPFVANSDNKIKFAVVDSEGAASVIWDIPDHTERGQVFMKILTECREKVVNLTTFSAGGK